MKRTLQQHYNESIDLIGHLILTKPTPVIHLLRNYNIVFPTPPNRKQLIHGVVELLKENDPKFLQDLGALLTTHIQHKGKEMLKQEGSEFHGYADEDEDAFWGALAKGAIGIVGGLFKKKKKNRGSSGKSAAMLAASRANAQAAIARRDMERRMREMQLKRLEERMEIQRKEEARKREADRKAAAKKQNVMFLAIGGVVLLGGIVFAVSNKSKGQPSMHYVSPQVPAAVPVAS